MMSDQTATIGAHIYIILYLIMSSDELARYSILNIGESQLMYHDDPQQEDQQFDGIDEFSQNWWVQLEPPLCEMGGLYFWDLKSGGGFEKL